MLQSGCELKEIGTSMILWKRLRVRSKPHKVKHSALYCTPMITIVFSNRHVHTHAYHRSIESVFLKTKFSCTLRTVLEGTRRVHLIDVKLKHSRQQTFSTFHGFFIRKGQFLQKVNYYCPTVLLSKQKLISCSQ